VTCACEWYDVPCSSRATREDLLCDRCREGRCVKLTLVRDGRTDVYHGGVEAGAMKRYEDVVAGGEVL
jgi:hypothetical protein